MHIATVGTQEISYIDEGSGFPVLLIHGLAGDNSAWQSVIPHWSKSFRIIAPDSRGAGKSTQTDAHVTLEEMAQDFLGLLDSLQIEKCHVVGRSMGGAISQCMYKMAPNRIQSLSWVASCAKFDPAGYRNLVCNREIIELSQSWATWARHTVTSFVSPAFFNANPAVVARIEQLVAAETRLIACYVRQNHAVLTHDALAWLHEIQCPVFILSGGLDPLCGPLATKWMVERLPHAKWSDYPDASHFFWVEHPDRFVSELSAWFVQNTPASQTASS